MFSLIAYVLFLFINQQVKIKSKKDELSKLNSEIVEEKKKTDSMLEEIEKRKSQGGSDNSRVRIFENVTQ